MATPIWIAYLDESYDKQRFWLGALVCGSSDILAITTGLDGIANAAHHRFGTAEKIEFHGHELFHGRGQWSGLFPRMRINVYQDALDVVGATGAAVVIEGVDVEKLHRRYGAQSDPPHEIALRHLIERLDEFAAARGSTVLTVADDVPSHRNHQRDLWHFQRYATPGYKPRKIRNVLDTIYFGPSDASRMLQAIDLVSFLWHRMISKADRDARAIRANEVLWRAIEGRVHHHRIWPT